jgi:hypothetical protein
MELHRDPPTSRPRRQAGVSQSIGAVPLCLQLTPSNHKLFVFQCTATMQHTTCRQSMPHSSALTAHRAEQHICQATQNPVAQSPVCMFPGGTSNVNSPKDPTTLNSCCIAGQSYLRSPLTSVHKTVHGQHASARTKYSKPPTGV